VIVEALARSGRPFGPGSGVILERGLVVTNHHVVDGASGVRVRQGRRQWPAKVLRSNRDHDLALLSVDGLGTSAMPLRTSSELKAGERVWAVGAPQALELSLSEGIISGLRPAEAANLIQTTASISPGSSGGGLFDDRAVRARARAADGRAFGGGPRLVQRRAGRDPQGRLTPPASAADGAARTG
jgi:S1-C subfamily serine protease